MQTTIEYTTPSIDDDYLTNRFNSTRTEKSFTTENTENKINSIRKLLELMTLNESCISAGKL